MALPTQDGGGGSNTSSQGTGKSRRNPPPGPKITPSKTGQIQIQAPPPSNRPGPIQQVKAPPPIKPPPPIGRKDYLAGDADYNDYLSQSKRQLADLRAQQNSDSAMQGINFENQEVQLGQNRERDLASLLEDFAGRGLAQSGLYGEAMGDVNTQYDEMGSQLQLGNAQFIQAQKDAMRVALQEQTNGTMSAKQAALARRAAEIQGG